MSSLKDVFADDGSGSERMKRVIAKNKAAMKKAKSKKKAKITLQPMNGSVVSRSDEEFTDQTLKKFKTVDYMNLFLSSLPGRVKPVGFDEPYSEHVFKLIIEAFRNKGASDRGVARCLVVLAKNIQRQLAEFKLPLTELQLKRFSAYREGLAVKLKPYFLPEKSIEWLLASDSAENTDYEIIINRNDHTTELTLVSLLNDDSRTFRFLNNQINKHIQNKEILKEIEKHAENESA